MSSLIGKSLQGGKYKLKDVLGRGGFGLTFRAHQNYLDQVVVIKTLNESFWSAPNLDDLQRQFQDEARRLALCSHPNVVRVSDFFVEDQLPYMVMDYIPGRSLYDMVLPDNGPAKPLSEAVAVGYVAQIGKALQAVHAKGLLHRDVKPQNIMIHQHTGQAVLIDFGIARELSQNPNKTHTSIVSEGYAPIEQYLPKAQRSAATDLYGLAATLYTLLTGEIPVAAVLRDRTPLTPLEQLRPDVSPAVVSAIASGMQIELKDRPQSVNRWVTLLTSGQTKGQTKGFTRTQRPNSVVQSPAQIPASPSEFPTKVVSPAYQSTSPAATEGKTVAMPVPNVSRALASTANDGGTVVAPLAQPEEKNRGCGYVLRLAGVTVALALSAAFAGFWLMSRLGAVPQLSFPEIGLPAEDSPDAGIDPSGDEQASETTEPETDESTDEQIAKEPKEKKPPQIEDQSDGAETSPGAGNGGSTGQLPLVLNGTGNPANDRPGNVDRSVVIPGFAPGDSEDQIRNRLGAPTQDSVVDGFYTSVYELVPNRVSLAYTYEQGSTQVRQSEATFSPGTDFLKMRTAVSGMVEGASTEVVNGLRAVQTGERDRVEFNNRGLSGVIERNTYGHIHVYVR